MNLKYVPKPCLVTKFSLVLRPEGWQVCCCNMLGQFSIHSRQLLSLYRLFPPYMI